MTKSRIAIFEGYGRRRSSKRSSKRRYGASLFENPRLPSTRLLGYGAPLLENPRLPSTRLLGYGSRRYGYDVETMPPGMGAYGRRGYYVDPLYGPASYGPGKRKGKRKSLRRKGYHVKKSRNSSAQVRFKKAAKKCARVSRRKGSRKGSFQVCMRKALKKSRRSRR